MEIKALKNGYKNLVIQNKWFGAKASQELLDIVSDKDSLKSLIKMLKQITEQDAPSKSTKTNKATANAELIAQIVAQVLKSSK